MFFFVETAEVLVIQQTQAAALRYVRLSNWQGTKLALLHVSRITGVSNT